MRSKMNKTKSQLIKKLLGGNEITLEQAEVLGDINVADKSKPFKYVIRGDNFLGSAYHSKKKKVAIIAGSQRKWVAKRFNSEGDLEGEFKKCVFFYNLGAELAKPIDFCNVYNMKEKNFNLSIVLEFLQGSTPYKLRKRRSKYSNRAENLQKRMTRNATEKGIHVRDCNDENAIYNLKTGKLKLIDPELWELREEN
jgi:hypothetical protein